MRRLLTALMAFAIPLLANAHPHYSRVIIFGDSLSDIGNMPESPALIEPAFNSIALNLYVPISNPYRLDNTPSHYTVINTKQNYHFPKGAPQPQPLLHINKKPYARTAHSLGWPQFFTQDATEKSLLKSAQIWPWFWFKTHGNTNPNLSVDYAFAGAVTDDMCRDFSYQHPNSSCTEKSILSGQAAYRVKGFSPTKGQPVSAVQVPGLQKQVQLFLKDSAKQPNLATSKTLYVILIGGNDLNLALMDLKHRKIISAFGRVLNGSAHRVRLSLQTLIEKRNARHIVVFNLFDTSQLPYIQTGLWQKGVFPMTMKPSFLKFSKLMTKIYNREIKYVVKRIERRYDNKKHQVDIQLFNLYDLMNNLQKLPTFSNPASLYQTCLGDSSQRKPSYYTSPNNCKSGNARYLFWNGAHPAMYLHQAIANALTKQLITKARPVQAL